jgi:hypothetical protein
MKYNSKNKIVAFSTDEEVSKFHDQLTDILREAMLKVGGDEANGKEDDMKLGKEDDMKLTKEFFERYSVLAETLSSLRAHLPREADARFN